MVNEISRLSRPMTDEDRVNETEKILESIKEIDVKNIKSMIVCIVSADPTEKEPTRMRVSHHVVGSRGELATMLSSTYGVLGRTFDAEEEAKEMPKESMQ